MERSRLRLWCGLLLTTVILAGCAMHSSEQASPSTAFGANDPGNLAFYYRQQAVSLSKIAERLEWEAEWYAKYEGENSKQAMHHYALAKAARTSAEKADALAREYRSQLPHARVY